MTLPTPGFSSVYEPKRNQPATPTSKIPTTAEASLLNTLAMLGRPNVRAQRREKARPLKRFVGQCHFA